MLTGMKSGSLQEIGNTQASLLALPSSTRLDGRKKYWYRKAGHPEPTDGMRNEKRCLAIGSTRGELPHEQRQKRNHQSVPSHDYTDRSKTEKLGYRRVLPQDYWEALHDVQKD